MSFKKGLFWVVFLIFLTFTTRFLGLNWSNNFSFHPDENNMVNAVLSLKLTDLNPHFFAYGQFPLYLTFFTNPKHDFLHTVLTLRFWSAFFSSISILFFYLIGKKIFKSNTLSKIFSLFLIFTPGLIQLAHFGTTESILIFVFSANIYLSFCFFDNPQKTRLLFLTGLISGIGIASKISALIFITPICLTFLFLLLKNPQKTASLILKFIIFILITLLFSVLLSPFSFINFSDFRSSMRYEIGVADGSLPVFYTRQFIGSTPYLFQFQRIFPYTNGIFLFIFSFIGFSFLFGKLIKKITSKQIDLKINPYLLITLFSALIYFIYQGQLFTKWTRFMSPIFFVAPLLSLFFIETIKNKIYQSILVFLAILPGIYFFISNYFNIDVRVQATEWINQNIPDNSTVLSESGNVVDIPLFDSKLNINNYDFYQLDINQSDNELTDLINQSDYIFIPSRRVFKNQNNSSFPLSQQYYQSLFSGSLGFSQIKIFSKSNSLLLNSENAEETWSVFDNPVVRIYQKNEL